MAKIPNTHKSSGTHTRKEFGTPTLTCKCGTISFILRKFQDGSIECECRDCGAQYPLGECIATLNR